MLCMHKTTILCQFGLIICHQFTNSYLHQFSTIFGGNCIKFDSENKNRKWYDAIKLEMESMLEYKVFKKWDKAILDKHKKVTNPPKGYHRIKVHLEDPGKIFQTLKNKYKFKLKGDGPLDYHFGCSYKQDPAP